MNICPVCGYNNLLKPAYGLSGNDASYEICMSCDYQYGVTDDDKGISQEQWREKWIADGLPWRSPMRYLPKGWDGKKQLENIGIVLG